MRNILRILLVIPLSIMLWGCGGDGNDIEDEPQIPSSNAEYYIKYEATVKVFASNGVSRGTVNYTVSTDTGTKSFTSGLSFSQTFGPVKKGFHATFSANPIGCSATSCTANIYVCRGSEPFALKANGSGVSSASTSYTIDY